MTFATRLAKSPEAYCLKNDVGSDSTRENVAASHVTSSFMVTRAIMMFRHALMRAVDIATPTSSAPMGAIRLACPEGATVPNAILFAHAGKRPMTVTANAAMITSM